MASRRRALLSLCALPRVGSAGAAESRRTVVRAPAHLRDREISNLLPKRQPRTDVSEFGEQTHFTQLALLLLVVGLHTSSSQPRHKYNAKGHTPPPRRTTAARPSPATILLRRPSRCSHLLFTSSRSSFAPGSRGRGAHQFTLHSSAQRMAAGRKGRPRSLQRSVTSQAARSERIPAIDSTVTNAAVGGADRHANAA